MLKSPVVVDIVQLLRRRGPATVAEIGQRMGRRPNSLHYHIRKMLEAGFVREVGSQRSGARTESIYDVTAEQFVGSNAPRSEPMKQLTRSAAAALCRLAGRDFARATEQPARLVEQGDRRNVLVKRSAARLSKTQLAQLNRHLRAIDDIFNNNLGAERGQLCALTLVLTPINDVQAASPQERG